LKYGGRESTDRELAQLHADSGGWGGGEGKGGRSGRRQVNAIFSLSSNFSYKAVCPPLEKEEKLCLGTGKPCLYTRISTPRRLKWFHAAVSP
jgi:hypothetical protein